MNAVLELNLSEDLVAVRSEIDRALEIEHVSKFFGRGPARFALSKGKPDKRVTVPLGKDSYPYACLVDAEGKRLFVSLWSKAAVAVVDLGQQKVPQTFATDRHPTEMLLALDGKTLHHEARRRPRRRFPDHHADRHRGPGGARQSR